MKLGKAELVAKIAESAGLTKVQADKALTAVVETIKDTLKEGGSVSLVGFGTFMVAERQARKGHNPSTGQEIEIPAGKTPKFKAGKGLKDLVK